MSVHSAGWAPATRVASRKLGPVGGSVSPPSARVAWATRRLASTWGRCETAAITRSCVAASMATGRAPRPATRRCSRSSRTPELPVVGVRYQVAPSNRSARACSTPAASRRAASRGRGGGEERGLAGDGGGGLDALRVGAEVAGAQLLGPVADRLLGHRVDLHDQAVGARRGGGQAERLDEVAPARRVAGVDDHGQVAEL